MIPVDQTRYGLPEKDEPTKDPPGNCWTACVASILELPLSEIPDEAAFWKPGMTPMESWRPYLRSMHEWLHERGITLIEVAAKNLNFCGPIECFEKFPSILVGPSPRNPERGLHAVVGLGGNIIHDPHWSRAGLSGEPLEWSHDILIANPKFAVISTQGK